MLDWLRDHFGVNFCHASFSTPVTFGVVSLRFIAWQDCYDVQAELLGFGMSATYYRDGKGSIEGIDLSDIFEAATVTMTWECYQDMKRDQDELRAIKGRHAD